MSLRKNFGRGGAAALVLAGAFVALPAMAADHRDGAAAAADPSSDINDVYAFMNGDNLVLGMTVSPFADADATFSDAVQFVWHVNTWNAFTDSIAGIDPALQTTVQCEFDEAQMIQCWIHRDGENLDYIMGDASSEEGIATASSQVFAGLRSDPFYFYLTGFNAARSAVISEVTAGNVDLSNGTLCPELTGGQLDALGDALTASGPGAQGLNDFLGANTLAIVLEVDKALFTDAENDVVSVHAATHAKP